MRKALLVLVFGLLLSACNVFTAKPINQKANADPYEATSAQARPDVESHIELSDGAGISIPAGALSAEITVKVERNPEKAQKLPPLDEGLLPVSNFYNFEIAGGVLNDRVDLTLPFDKSLIPDDQKSGILVAAIPDGTGWKYMPVEPQDNKVVLWTDQIGDPIIAWNLIRKEDYKPICNPYIDIQVDPQVGPTGTEFTVIGRVKPFSTTFLDTLIDKPERAVAGIPVSIYLSQENYIAAQTETLTVTTDGTGYFSAKLPENIKQGFWFLRANAKCPIPEGVLFKKIVPSEGRVAFQINPVEAKAETVATKVSETAPTEVVKPTETTAPIPSGAIQIPDVVGLSLDDAVKKLENLGFGVTWVDGKSSLELGQIYQQKPAAGEFFVPHRTTVVVFRTIFQIPSPTQTPTEPVATPNLYPKIFKFSGTGTITFFNGKNTCKNVTVEEVNKDPMKIVVGLKITNNGEIMAIDNKPNPHGMRDLFFYNEESKSGDYLTTFSYDAKLVENDTKIIGNFKSSHTSSFSNVCSAEYGGTFVLEVINN